MELKTITPDLSVGPQLHPGDLPDLSAAGFRAILCARPDSEGEDQPDFETIAAAAAPAGLKAAYVPAVVGEMTEETVTAFAAAFADLPKPVLAYCGSGKRAETLWSLHQNKDPHATSVAG